MKLKDLTTVNVTVKQYWDRKNGNRYFSARMTLNPGTFEKVIYIPFQYGPGAHYETVLGDTLRAEFPRAKSDKDASAWQFCDKRKIALNTIISRKSNGEVKFVSEKRCRKWGKKRTSK